jgi:peroxiredoxin
MNARREYVWNHEGEPDAHVLAEALAKHLVAGPLPRARPLRLAVATGDRPPDILYGDERGNHIRLRWLRGQSVLLNFWQPWSTASIKELVRLEGLAKGAGRQAPFIVAFHGGKDRKTLEEVRKQHNLSIVLAHDPEQRVARIFGVRCWPTTIAVGAEGRIDHVQFGIVHDHPPPPVG